MALCPEKLSDSQPFVLIPNPFYQVYMISALSVNSEPLFISTDEQSGHLPDYFGLKADILNKTSAAYICSPSNPQGAVATADYLTALIELAENMISKYLQMNVIAKFIDTLLPQGYASFRKIRR